MKKLFYENRNYVRIMFKLCRTLSKICNQNLTTSPRGFTRYVVNSFKHFLPYVAAVSSTRCTKYSSFYHKKPILRQQMVNTVMLRLCTNLCFKYCRYPTGRRSLRKTIQIVHVVWATAKRIESFLNSFICCH